MRGKWMAVTVLALGLLLGLIAGQGEAQDTAPQEATAPQDLVGMAFTYQGKLNKGGSPHTGTCSFRFSLHDALSGGSQIGITQTVGGVDVVDGLFTVAVNDGSEFGGGPFRGEARWLAIAVQCAGDIGYTGLDTRQELTPAPYALALPGLWTVQNLTSPNVFGGWQGNGATLVGIQGATIGGGGDALYPNQVAGRYATVGGGKGNQANRDRATIGGGLENVVDGFSATVGGGVRNLADGLGATISGGEYITASGTVAAVGGGFMNTASFTGTTIAGGLHNAADGEGATVGGGQSNTALYAHTTVGGGRANEAHEWGATVGGGISNTAILSQTTIGGGQGNAAQAAYATVCGGFDNIADGDVATIGGGESNQTSAHHATIGGGQDNVASARYATVPGGYRAVASHHGQMAYASGSFDWPPGGDAQTSVYVLRNTTTGNAWTELFLDGVASRLRLADNRTVTFDIWVAARSDGGLSAGYWCRGTIERIGGSISLFAGSACAWDSEEDSAWDVRLASDDANHALLVEVRGNYQTIRWVATVRTAEVAW
jgi:hypothetical protein